MTKWVFSGGQCGRCESLAGEHDEPLGQQHEHCGCYSYPILDTCEMQGTREECQLDSTVEVDRELVDTSEERLYSVGENDEAIRVTNTYVVTVEVILVCVRVDADTGEEIGEPYLAYMEDFYEDVREHIEVRPRLVPIPSPRLVPIPTGSRDR